MLPSDAYKLVALFIFHWVVISIASFYVIFRKNSKYDWIYFIVVCGTVASWFVVQNECPVSLIEKKIMNKQYKIGDLTTSHPSMFLYCNDLQCTTVIGIVLESLMGYGIYVMLSIYNVRSWLKTAVITSYILLILHDMYEHIKLDGTARAYENENAKCND
jgi:hypothetical protein